MAGLSLVLAPLSYYEFKQAVDQRLTDEQWKDMLKQGQQAPRPLWIDSFYDSG